MRPFKRRIAWLHHPRWLWHFLAWTQGYFWMPCSRCGRMFGGNEWGGSVWWPEKHYSGGSGCCPWCPDQYYPSTLSLGIFAEWKPVPRG